MWYKSSRRQRHAGKHGNNAAAPYGTLTPLGELAGESSYRQLPVHERLFSDSTEAWLRQMAEVEEGQANDFDTEGRALLEQAAILRRRVAEVRAYLAAGTAPNGTQAASEQTGIPDPAAEVKHWVDGAWQPACGELSGVVAENRDAVTCAGCNYQLGNPAAAAQLVDTAALRRYREQPQPADGANLWQPPAQAQIPQFRQVDLTGVLAAAKHDAERLTAVTRTPPWPVPDEDEPLHGGGHWTPGAERDNLDAYFATAQAAPVGGVA